jgi:hypothetical protein
MVVKTTNAGTSWFSVVTSYATAGKADFTAIDVYTNKNVYLAYRDIELNKLSVSMFQIVKPLSNIFTIYNTNINLPKTNININYFTNYFTNTYTNVFSFVNLKTNIVTNINNALTNTNVNTNINLFTNSATWDVIGSGISAGTINNVLLKVYNFTTPAGVTNYETVSVLYQDMKALGKLSLIQYK